MSYGPYIRRSAAAPRAPAICRRKTPANSTPPCSTAACRISNWAPILGLRVKGESLDEMLGFLAATDERTHQFEMPTGAAGRSSC